jgi:hypothetical protein
MCIASASPVVGYAGLFLGAAGIYPQIPLLISWASNNMGGQLKRAVGMAIVVSVGNMGGVVSSYVVRPRVRLRDDRPSADAARPQYRAVDRPRYFPGHGTVLGSLIATFFAATIMMFYLQAQNRKRAALLQSRGKPWTAEEKAAHQDEGDNAPFFICACRVLVPFCAALSCERRHAVNGRLYVDAKGAPVRVSGCSTVLSHLWYSVSAALAAGHPGRGP